MLFFIFLFSFFLLLLFLLFPYPLPFLFFPVPARSRPVPAERGGQRGGPAQPRSPSALCCPLAAAARSEGKEQEKESEYTES